MNHTLPTCQNYHILDIYSHVLPQNDRQAAKAIAGPLRPAS